MSSMRGMFFIVKGQYAKRGEKFFNEASEEYNYLGGFNPYDKDTKEWYQLVDNETFMTISCGGDLDKILLAIKNYIITYKTKESYLKMVTNLSTTKSSDKTYNLMKHIYTEYGDFMQEDIKRVEEIAYTLLGDSVKKGIKKVKKSGVKKMSVDNEIPPTEETPKKVTEEPHKKQTFIKKKVARKSFKMIH